jgi:hypothetical protein
MDQDTSPEQSARYHRLLRQMTLSQRVAATASLCDGIRAAAMAELRVRLMVRLYGRLAAERVFGEVPSDAI